MRKSKSESGGLFRSVINLAVLAVLGSVAWHAYSQLEPVPSSVSASVEANSFNCRTALAHLAKDYACRDSDSCSMTRDQLTDLENREANIEQFCN